MLIHSISVKNIRSYNDGSETTLEFPDGVTLLEGDIGSGKSTLLYALEFALFGFSDMKGLHLLSEGRREGRVSVSFESAGEEYTIERGLKTRGDDVVQEECYITSQGERTRLSPSDLKERIVSILGFNEPTHPRAESLVYRYAVFTPQEQMKEILTQNPEERLHVIRRVLGAQSYQVAAENSDLVERGVKRLAYGLKKASEDLETKKDELDEAGKTNARLQGEIPQLEAADAAAGKAVRRLEAEWKESLAEREGLGKSEGKIPVLRKEVAELELSIDADQRRLEEVEGELADEIEPVLISFARLETPMAKAKDLQASLYEAKERLVKLEGSRETLQAELNRTKDLLSKGVCPVCGQLITGDFHARAEHSESELQALDKEAAAAAASVQASQESLERAREFEQAEKEHAVALKDKSRADKEIDSLRSRLKESAARHSQRKAELDEASKEVKSMKEVSERVDRLEKKLVDARKVEKDAALDLNQARTELADSNRELRRLTDEVKKMQDAVDEARRLTMYQNWLSSFFRPTVELIEKQTLTQAAARFNEHFQRFFTSLVDDPDMVVRVKEDFSPVFEREGFEQDFAALSGGERTSMAMAYRFALNSVVRESVSSQPELVILDEPTDGFSREQVYKMRGLLEELDSRQVILVSHEKELESMADHIFKVDKRNGTSVIAKVQP